VEKKYNNFWISSRVFIKSVRITVIEVNMTWQSQPQHQERSEAAMYIPPRVRSDLEVVGIRCLSSDTSHIARVLLMYIIQVQKLLSHAPGITCMSHPMF
jgi:hypothetical protein